MATDTYTLEYVAKIEKLQAELAKIPGATDRSALAAAQRLESRLDKAGKTAGKGLQTNIGGSLASLAKAGGFGGLVEQVGHLGAGLGGLGPAAGVAAGGLAAVGVAAAAINAEVGLVSLLYDAAKASGELDGETQALDTAMTDLQKSIGKQVAPEFETLLLLLVAGTFATQDIATEFGKAATATVDWYEDLGILGKAFANYVAPALAGVAANRQFRDAIEAGTKAEGSYLARAKEAIGVADEKKKKTDEETGAKKAHTTATRDHTTALEAEIAALQQRDEWMAKAVALDQMEADILAGLTPQIAANSEAIAEQQQLRADEAMARAQMVDDMRAQTAQTIADRRTERDVFLSTGADIAGGIGQMLGLLADQEGVSRKTAKALVIAQKAAGIAQVGISTAVAIMQALASFGPAGPFVAAGYAVTGAAQAAVIAATPLPKFHQGGTMQGDEGIAVVRQGERVMTQRAAKDYDQGLGDLNRGAGAGGGGGSTRVSFEGRDLDVMLARVVRQHGATRRELDGRRVQGAY